MAARSTSDLVAPHAVTTLPQVEALAGYMEQMLIEQSLAAEIRDAYYCGEFVPAIVLADYCEVFGEGRRGEPLLQPPQVNICRVGVDAVSERLRVQSFTVADPDGSNDKVAAQAVLQVWAANELPLMHGVGITESLIKRVSYLLTWPGDDGRAVISVEDATQMVVHRQSAPPYGVDAAMKVTADEWTGDTLAWLWIIGQGMWSLSQGDDGRWTVLADGPVPIPSPLGGQVPIVEVARRPRLLKPPVGALDDVMPLQDTYTFLFAQMAIAATFGAIPIRTATGIKLPRLRDNEGRILTDADGVELVDPDASIELSAARVLTAENKDAEFGTLEASDLAGFVAAIGMVGEQVRGITAVPQHYYEGAPSGTSSETLKAAESNMVRRVEGDQEWAGAAYPKALRHAMLLDGSQYARAPITTVWVDPETFVPAQQVDAAQKLVTIGVPLEIALREELHWAPELIEEVKKLAPQQDALAVSLLEAARQQVGAGGVPGLQPAGGSGGSGA